MARVSIITDLHQTRELEDWLKNRGFKPRVIHGNEDVLENIEVNGARMVILLVSNYILANNLARMIKQEKPQPVLMLVPGEKLKDIKLPIEADDFAAYPAFTDEFYLRLCRLLPGNGYNGDSDKIDCGALVIDPVSCEAHLYGELLELTFREYELLKFLASNRGRTFTREALLNRVWGYEYFGGDRTVDVHVRRLRTKLVDLEKPYIETVRNIGYRFRKQDQ